MARSSTGPVLLLALLLVVATGGVVATPTAPAQDSHSTLDAPNSRLDASVNETANESTGGSSPTTTTATSETVIGAVGDAVGDTVDEPVDATTDTISTTDTATDTVTNTTDGATDTVSNTTAAVTDAATNTTDVTTDLTNSTVDSVTDTTDTATDGVDSATNATAGGLASTSKRLDGVLGTGDTVETVTSPVVGATEVVDETTDTVDATTDTVDDTTESLGGTTDSLVSETADTVDVVITGVSGATGSVLHVGISSETDVTTDASIDDSDGPMTAGGGPQTTASPDDGSTDDSGGSVEVRTSIESTGTDGGVGGPATWLRQHVGGLVPIDGPLGGAGAAGAAGVGVLAVSGYATRQWLSQSASTGGTGTRTLLSAGFAEGLDGWVEKLKRLVVPLRYSRYDDSDPLEHDARRGLYEAIEDAPGVYLTDLAERADVPVSTARHHVRVLADERLVRTAKRHGKRRFYPATVDDSALADALSEPAKASVLHALAEHEEAHVGLLADELDRDPSTVTHHLQALAEDDLVERERQGRTVVNRLVPDVEPALAGRERASDPGDTSTTPADD